MPPNVLCGDEDDEGSGDLSAEPASGGQLGKLYTHGPHDVVPVCAQAYNKTQGSNCNNLWVKCQANQDSARCEPADDYPGSRFDCPLIRRNKVDI